MALKWAAVVARAKQVLGRCCILILTIFINVMTGTVIEQMPNALQLMQPVACTVQKA